jgi:U3 small nucleolar RNA-associated protein 21
VDVFRRESIAKSLAYSPNGEFLVTSLHDSVGILLWMNKTVFSHVSLMPIPADFEPPLVPAPEVIQDEDAEEEIIQEYTSPVQLSENLVTLSLLPESRWKNLLNLDTIKMRNRPKQPPKNYEAPFFLSGLTAKADAVEGVPADQVQLDSEPKNALAVKQATSIIPQSKFVAKLLQPEKDRTHYEGLCAMLGSMPPNEVETELRSLALVGDESVTCLKEFLLFLHEIFSTNRFYEASQAYLALFLKIHGDTIRANEELKLLLQDFSRILESRDTQLIEQINSILAFTSFLKSTLF